MPLGGLMRLRAIAVDPTSELGSFGVGVGDRGLQHACVVDVVQNLTPDVLVIDEIGVKVGA